MREVEEGCWGVSRRKQDLALRCLGGAEDSEVDLVLTAPSGTFTSLSVCVLSWAAAPCVSKSAPGEQCPKSRRSPADPLEASGKCDTRECLGCLSMAACRIWPQLH